jgi:hypothetical protein
MIISDLDYLEVVFEAPSVTGSQGYSIALKIVNGISSITNNGYNLVQYGTKSFETLTNSGSRLVVASVNAVSTFESSV